MNSLRSNYFFHDLTCQPLLVLLSFICCSITFSVFAAKVYQSSKQEYVSVSSHLLEDKKFSL